MTLQILFKKIFSLTSYISLQTLIRKQLFFSSRNDLDLRKNADSVQKCEKNSLTFYVTTKLSKGNDLSVFAQFCLLSNHFYVYFFCSFTGTIVQNAITS